MAGAPATPAPQRRNAPSDTFDLVVPGKFKQHLANRVDREPIDTAVAIKQGFEIIAKRILRSWYSLSR